MIPDGSSTEKAVYQQYCQINFCPVGIPPTSALGPDPALVFQQKALLTTTKSAPEH